MGDINVYRLIRTILKKGVPWRVGCPVWCVFRQIGWPLTGKFLLRGAKIGMWDDACAKKLSKEDSAGFQQFKFRDPAGDEFSHEDALQKMGGEPKLS